jgi:3-hydroxybutyryl-CoA dehydratase
MINTLKIGDSYSFSKTVESIDVEKFAEVSTDTNPVHLDEEYAKKTMFGRRIAHGMLGVSYISSILGTKFPGEGTIYLGQTVKFLAPVFIGDTLEVKAEIKELKEGKNDRAILRTTCTNQDGKIVIDGEATVILPKKK